MKPAVQVPDLLTPGEVAVLRAEAREAIRAAEPHQREGYELVDGERLIGPVRNAVSLAGDIRDSLHTRHLAARLARWASLGQLVPEVSSYLYYEPGDFIALHRDQPSCQVDVLVLLEGSPGPLHVHPDLAGLPGPELRQAAAASGGHPVGGIPIDLRRGAVVLHGYEVPHHRPPHQGTGLLVLAAFCFRRL